MPDGRGAHAAVAAEQPFPEEYADDTYLTDGHGLYRVLAANRRTFEVWLEDCMEPECVTVTLVTELIGFRVVNQPAETCP